MTFEEALHVLDKTPTIPDATLKEWATHPVATETLQFIIDCYATMYGTCEPKELMLGMARACFLAGICVGCEKEKQPEKSDPFCSAAIFNEAGRMVYCCKLQGHTGHHHFER